MNANSFKKTLPNIIFFLQLRNVIMVYATGRLLESNIKGPTY